MSKDLKPKLKAFADYYIETGNEVQSAIRAGYSEKYAKAQAYKLLENVGVSSYIAERVKPTEQKRIATADEVMEFFTAVMRGEIKDAFDLPPSLADRKDAAKELAKRTVDIESRKANTDIIKNMQTVADILLGAVPDRNIEDYE
jgi:phage terminase small subunit